MAERTTRKATRERLIKAAGELFAEKGFKETTIRDISVQAGANVAAVNYYFRDKESLYEDVVLYILKNMHKTFPVDRDFGKASSPEARLHTFIRNLLYRFLDPDRPGWQGTLLAWERTAPRAAALSMIHEEIAKTRSILASIMKELLGSAAEQENIELCGSSVMGQIMSQAHIHSPQAPPLLRKEGITKEEIERIAHHISEFSLAGIRRIRMIAEGKDDSAEKSS